MTFWSMTSISILRRGHPTTQAKNTKGFSRKQRTDGEKTASLVLFHPHNIHILFHRSLWEILALTG